MPVVAVPFRLAAKGQPLAIAEARRRIGLVEPNAFEAVLAVVAQDNADDGTPVD
jgi:hypothetical protein